MLPLFRAQHAESSSAASMSHAHPLGNPSLYTTNISNYANPNINTNMNTTATTFNPTTLNTNTMYNPMIGNPNITNPNDTTSSSANYNINNNINNANHINNPTTHIPVNQYDQSLYQSKRHKPNG